MLSKKVHVNIMDCLDVRKSWKVQKVIFFEYVRNEAMLAIVFYFFPKYAICVFLRTCKFCMFSKKLMFSITNATWESMRLLGAKYTETFGCMSMPFGCMSMDRLGACLWIGWVHVCGCWVQSLRLRLGACLIVGSLPDSR